MCPKFLLVLTLLLSSCLSAPELPKAQPIVTQIEPEMEQIEAKGGPGVKPHVEKVRSLYPHIKRVEHKAEEQSTLEKYLPWVIAIGSILYFLWGVQTKDIEDTIGGVIGLIFGITLSYLWTTIAWAGLIVLGLFITGWWAVSRETKKIKNKDRER